MLTSLFVVVFADFSATCFAVVSGFVVLIISYLKIKPNGKVKKILEGHSPLVEGDFYTLGKNRSRPSGHSGRGRPRARRASRAT